MSDGPQGPGWWQASDGRWYEPDLSQLPDPPLPEGQWRASKGISRDTLIAALVVGPFVLLAAWAYLNRWF